MPRKEGADGCLHISTVLQRSQLQTLLGQVQVYSYQYGPNLIVIIFNDFAKVQDVNEFANLVRA